MNTNGHERLCRPQASFDSCVFVSIRGLKKAALRNFLDWLFLPPAHLACTFPFVVSQITPRRSKLTRKWFAHKLMTGFDSRLSLPRK